MKLWFNNFVLQYLDDEVAIITTTSDGFIDLLNKKYTAEIEEFFTMTLGFHVDVKICAASTFDLEKALMEIMMAKASPASAPAPVHTQTPAPEQIPEPQKPAEEAPAEEVVGTTFVSEKDYTFENFIVGSSNKLAHAASVAVANHPTAYNPLFLYGSSGLGKTHLMKAIANEIKRTTPDFNIIFVKGEDFTNELVRSIEKKTTAKFKDKYRNADMLLIDDIQFIAGKVATQ